MVSIVDKRLRSDLNGTIDRPTTAAFFKSAVEPKKTARRDPGEHTTATIVRTVLYWALEWKDMDLYRHVGICALKWLDTQETVLSMVGRHLQDRFTDPHSSEIIEWETQ